MKGCLRFLVVLAVLAGIGYFWWQSNAQRMIEAEVKRQGKHFFVNTDALQVKNDPVTLLDLRRAKVPKLVISGEDLQLRAGLMLKSVKLVLTDVVVSGPPFNISHVGGGYYTATVTDGAVTEFVRKRIGSLPIAGRALNDLTVHFGEGRAHNTVVGAWDVPLLGKRDVIANGYPVPAGQIGKIDFRVTDVSVAGLKMDAKPVVDALNLLNPVVDVSEWPLDSDFKSVTTHPGTVTVKAEISHWRGGGLLPQ